MIGLWARLLAGTSSEWHHLELTTVIDLGRQVAKRAEDWKAGKC